MTADFRSACRASVFSRKVQGGFLSSPSPSPSPPLFQPVNLSLGIFFTRPNSVSFNVQDGGRKFIVLDSIIVRIAKYTCLEGQLTFNPAASFNVLPVISDVGTSCLSPLTSIWYWLQDLNTILLENNALTAREYFHLGLNNLLYAFVFLNRLLTNWAKLHLLLLLVLVSSCPDVCAWISLKPRICQK